MRLSKTITLLTMFFVASAGQDAWAQQRSKKVDIRKLKRDYWSEGSQYEVVQNRLYSKSGKFQLGAFYGVSAADPFLSITQFGGSLGYNFSEFIGVNALYWKYSVSGSSALEELEKTENTTNSNEPTDYKGGEVVFNLIYGKLSLLGKAIIHYDLHLSAGAGITGTDSGNNLTFSAGIGQQFYVSKSLSIILDYRLMRFNELIVEKHDPANIGKVQAERVNYTNVITFGLGLMF